MINLQNIKPVFDFLIVQFQKKMSFSADNLAQIAELPVSETNLIISDRLEELTTFDGKKYHVKPEILRVRFEDFKELFLHKKQLFSDYVLEVSSSIQIYEFFMPLSREDRLREALDNLFYKDAIEQRIQEIGLLKIREGLKLSNEFSDVEISKIVFDFMESAVRGYSIYLVNGRYRADLLATHKEVISRPFGYGPYIVDETTAIVRFIFPVKSDAENYEQGEILEPATKKGGTQNRAKLMSWLFLNFFAEALIRVVPKEDEIWLLESGMRSAFYRWTRRE